MISKTKLKKFQDYLTVFNIEETLEIANSFYSGYGEGYAQASEDSYNSDEKSQRIVDLGLEIQELEAENKRIANEKSILTERLKEAEDLLNHAYDCSFTDSKSQCSCGVIAYLDKYKIEDKPFTWPTKGIYIIPFTGTWLVKGEEVKLKAGDGMEFQQGESITLVSKHD